MTGWLMYWRLFLGQKIRGELKVRFEYSEGIDSEMHIEQYKKGVCKEFTHLYLSDIFENFLIRFGDWCSTGS